MNPYSSWGIFDLNKNIEIMITVGIQLHAKEVSFIRVKKSSNISRILKKFCHMTRLRPDSLIFWYKDHKVKADDTFASLNIGEYDFLQAVPKYRGRILHRYEIYARG